MSPNTLCIVGNGFDLAHGMRTSYGDFRAYLQQADTPLFRLIAEYFCEEEFWWSLESALAHFDAHSLRARATDFLVSYGADDWRDAYHHDYQFEISEVVVALSRTLKQRFTDWARQIELPQGAALLNIERTATFFTFNYTPTLQLLYGVPPPRVTHIHGRADDPTSELILGHAWKAKPVSERFAEDQLRDLDTRLLEGERIIDQYFEATFKPTKAIIKAHKGYFSGLTTVTRVLVAGHSLNEVDHPSFSCGRRRYWPAQRSMDSELSLGRRNPLASQKPRCDRCAFRHGSLQDVAELLSLAG